MPAKAGIQNYLKTLDSRLRGNDAKGGFKTFYATINVGRSMFDVQSFRRSSFKTTPYGINATCEHLQNNLALMLWISESRTSKPRTSEPRTLNGASYFLWHFRHSWLRQLFITSMDFSFENALWQVPHPTLPLKSLISLGSTWGELNLRGFLTAMPSSDIPTGWFNSGLKLFCRLAVMEPKDLSRYPSWHSTHWRV